MQDPQLLERLNERFKQLVAGGLNDPAQILGLIRQMQQEAPAGSSGAVGMVNPPVAPPSAGGAPPQMAQQGPPAAPGPPQAAVVGAQQAGAPQAAPQGPGKLEQIMQFLQSVSPALIGLTGGSAMGVGALGQQQYIQEQRMQEDALKRRDELLQQQIEATNQATEQRNQAARDALVSRERMAAAKLISERTTKEIEAEAKKPEAYQGYISKATDRAYQLADKGTAAIGETLRAEFGQFLEPEDLRNVIAGVSKAIRGGYGTKEETATSKQLVKVTMPGRATPFDAIFDPKLGSYLDIDTKAPLVGAQKWIKPNAPKDNSYAIDRVINNFAARPAVKNHNERVEKYLSIEQMLKKGLGGPRDLAVLFEFMKALDPDSVVRESEQKAAIASGNIFAGWAAKFNGYFKPEGGFLPQSVLNEFLNLTKIKLDVSRQMYLNEREQYGKQLDRYGASRDLLPDYDITGPTKKAETAINPATGKTIHTFDGGLTWYNEDGTPWQSK